MNEQSNLNASSVAQDTAQTPQLQDPYADLVLPESSSLTLQMFEELKQHAAEIKLPLQSVQKWVELEEKRLQQEAQDQAQAKHAQQQAWAQETRAHYGEAWQEEVSRAVRAADVFGGPELRQLLEETGLGNHPAIVRTFAAVGKRISEDVSIGGTAGDVSPDITFTQALYGKN